VWSRLSGSDGPAEEDKAIRNAVVDRMKEMVQSIAGVSEYNSNAPESIGGGGGKPDAGTTTPVPPQYGVSPGADVCACHDDETC